MILTSLVFPVSSLRRLFAETIKLVGFSLLETFIRVFNLRGMNEPSLRV
jgi:hypothetical protein